MLLCTPRIWYRFPPISISALLTLTRGKKIACPLIFTSPGHSENCASDVVCYSGVITTGAEREWVHSLHSYEYKCAVDINCCRSYHICVCVCVCVREREREREREKAVLILILCVTLWIYEGKSYAQTGILLFCPLSRSLSGLFGVLGLPGLFPSATQPYCTIPLLTLMYNDNIFALQAGRTQLWFPMGSLGFFTD
jgi:hypothetical protein